MYIGVAFVSIYPFKLQDETAMSLNVRCGRKESVTTCFNMSWGVLLNRQGKQTIELS